MLAWPVGLVRYVLGISVLKLLAAHTIGLVIAPNTVPAVTLGELINRFNIDPNDAVIKMDCEGCEFDVILSDYEHVRLFRELILEYHSNANKLLKVLSKDYRCDVRGIKILGITHCIRK